MFRNVRKQGRSQALTVLLLASCSLHILVVDLWSLIIWLRMRPRPPRKLLRKVAFRGSPLPETCQRCHRLSVQRKPNVHEKEAIESHIVRLVESQL